MTPLPCISFLMVVSLFASTASRTAALRAEAESLYAAGDYAAALERLESASRRDPDPALVGNQAHMLEKLGRYDEAAARYDSYLAAAPPPEKARRAREALDRIRPAVQITSTPPGADVYVDAQSRPAGRTPLTVPLVLGEHILRFERDGFERALVPARVERGRDITVGTTLVPRVTTRARPAAPSRGLTPGWVLLGSGLATGAFAGVAYVQADTFTDERDRQTSAAAWNERHEQARRYGYTAYVTAGLSALLMGVGAGLLLADEGEPAR